MEVNALVTELAVTTETVRGRDLTVLERHGLLRRVHGDVAFTGTTRVIVQRGLTTPDIIEADTKRTMIKAARHAVVLADHTKLGSVRVARFGALDEVDVLITDSDGEPELAEALRAAGPRVVCA